MALVCPYNDFDPPEVTPDEEIALFLIHVGEYHAEEYKWLFDGLAAMMRGLPVP